MATSEYALENDEAKSSTIYVRAIIDVAGVLRDRPVPPENAKAPTSVSLDSGQMFVTTTRGTADQSTGDIVLDASPGDSVRVYAKSDSNNFEQAVLIDRIVHAGDDEVVGRFKSVNLSQTLPAPVPKTADTPVDPVEQEFWFWQSAIAGEGSQDFGLILALYDRDEEGQPRFAGFYRWDLHLTVQCAPPDPHKQERTS